MTEERKEQNKDTLEQFTKPILPELALQEEWTLWEQWPCFEKTKSWQDTMQKVCAFSDLVNFG